MAGVFLVIRIYSVCHANVERMYGEQNELRRIFSFILSPPFTVRVNLANDEERKRIFVVFMVVVVVGITQKKKSLVPLLLQCFQPFCSRI